MTKKQAKQVAKCMKAWVKGKPVQKARKWYADGTRTASLSWREVDPHNEDWDVLNFVYRKPDKGVSGFYVTKNGVSVLLEGVSVHHE